MKYFATKTPCGRISAARLYDAGVLVRDMPNTPWVRVSCGWWTSDGDLERLLAAL